MSSVITIVCIIGILLGVVLAAFAVAARKKVPAFFTAIIAVVGILSILSSAMILLGVKLG